MPDDDPSDQVAMMFHGLVADLQRNDVACFEEEQKNERLARAALRHEGGSKALNAGELLKKLDGDPIEEQRRIDDDLARITKEAQAAAASKDKKDEPLPAGHFPPPPVSR
jgi:DNA-binding SARP family transcriptional activator